MNADDLEIFNSMPILFWVRSRDGQYLWANNAIKDVADNDMIGLTDKDMPWSEHRKDFLKSDHHVYDTGETDYVHEYMVQENDTGTVYKINICKWQDEFEGKKAVFGITMIIEHHE